MSSRKSQLLDPFDGGLLRGELIQVEVGDILPQRGLIVFDDEQVIGLFGFDQITGGVLLGVERSSTATWPMTTAS
jgi:hypothetical protein